jgi:hypothetical protein
MRSLAMKEISQSHIAEKARALGIKNPANPSAEDITLFLTAFLHDDTLSIEEYRQYLQFANCPPMTFILGYEAFSESVERKTQASSYFIPEEERGQ